MLLQPADKTDEVPPTPDRIVSLMPPITETLFAIGAGDRVVGRSDYCKFPREVKNLPMVGSTLHPNAEAISRLHPTLIVGERSVNSATRHLRALGTTRLLPWLTLPEIIAGTRALGELTGKREAAERIAARYESELRSAPPQQGPRVLLTIAHPPGRLTECWFLRRNSMHGAALHAAGAINAINEDISGTPSLSLEAILRIDPEVILILHVADDLPKEAERQLIADWMSLETLTAAKERRIGVLHGERFYSNGPRILGVVKELRAEIARLRG